MLIAHDLRKTMEDIVTKIEHIELESEPDFFDIYVEGCMLEPMQLQVT